MRTAYMVGLQVGAILRRLEVKAEEIAAEFRQGIEDGRAVDRAADVVGRVRGWVA